MIPRGGHLSLNKKPEKWQFYTGNYKNVFNYPSPIGILFLLKFLSDGIWYFMEIYITLSGKYFFSTVYNKGFIVCMHAYCFSLLISTCLHFTVFYDEVRAPWIHLEVLNSCFQWQLKNLYEEMLQNSSSVIRFLKV